MSSAAPILPTPSATASRQKRILVVNDSRYIRDFFSTNPLSPECLKIDCTQAEFFELAQQEPADLIITSAHTSTLDDLELLRELQELHGAGIKVIVLAPSTTPQDVIEALRAQAFSLFSVPFDQAALGDVIELALSVPLWSDGIAVVSAKPDWIALRVRCSRVAADRLIQFGHELDIQLPQETRDNLMLSFRELLLNAMEHGAQFNPQLKVDVGYLRTDRLLLYYLRDPGPGFQFQGLDHAAINNPEDEPFRHLAVRVEKGLRAGGFGIKLAEEMLDALIYNEKGNEVVLLKYL